MKKSKLKYLALPLCLSLCLVGCGKAEALPKQHAAETNVAVQTVYDMIKPENTTVSLKYDMKRIDGEVLGVYKDVYLVKTVDKDTMNNVTETYKLVNAVTGKELLTLNHTYPDGAYENGWYTDDYGNTWKAPTEMEVSFNGYAAPYVEVVTKTNTRIADEVLKEEFLKEEHLEKEKNNNGYVQTEKVDYYGIDGTKIASFNAPMYVDSYDYGPNSTTLVFGNVLAEIEDETGKVLQVWNSEKENRPSCFDYAGKNYGVFLKSVYGMYGAIETYTASGKLVNRYCYDSEDAQAFLLNNGNVLVQYTDETQGVTCDVIMDEQKYNVRTLLVDTLSGKVTQVETDYYFHEVFTKEAVKEEFAETDYVVSDALYNVAYATKMEGKDIYGQKQEIVFMNSALEISLVAENLHPEMYDFQDIVKLANGNYAIAVRGDFASYVIVDATFKTVRYLPTGAYLTPNFVVLADGIYNFDMECEYEFESDETLYGVFGQSIVLQGEYSWEEPFVKIVKLNAYGISYEETVTYYDVNVEEADNGYLLLQDAEDKTFKMVNLNTRSEVLTSIAQPEMTALSDGSYLVSVQLSNGETAYYVWSIAQNGGDNA